MTKRRRYALPVGIVLFAGAAIWWSVWFPYAPHRVRGAIPQRAVMVGEHENLARDVRLLLKNPSIRESIHVLGGPVDSIDAFLTSGLGRWLSACLGGRYTVTAFVPRGLSGAPAAWVVASWGGVRAQLTRWMMEVGLIPGWERLPGRAPIPCYRLRTQGDGPVLSAAIYEGVVLLAYSRDARRVMSMVRRLAYGRPSSHLFAGPERAGARVGVCWSPRVIGAPRGELRWSLPSTNTIALHAKWPPGLAVPMVLPQSRYGKMPVLMPTDVLPAAPSVGRVQLSESDRGLVRAGLGPLSGAVLQIPLSMAGGLLGGPEGGIKRAFQALIKPGLDTEGVLLLGLLRDAYSGRLLGIKTPSIVMAARTAPDFNLAAELPGLLDRCNAQLGMSLMARRRPDPDTGEVRFTIDEARNGIYASMKTNAKPVLWQVGRWIFLASNFAAAGEVNRAVQIGGDVPQPEWWAAAWARPNAIHGWCDFASAGSAVRKLSALHAIVRIAQGEHSQPAVTLMERTGRVVSALEPFTQGCMQVQAGPEAWKVDVRLGD